MTNLDNSNLKILFIGDIVGRAGRTIFKQNVVRLKKKHEADLVVVNCENAAGGFGLDRKTYGEILQPEVDLLTSGNHIWGRKEALELLDKKSDRLIRPANVSPDAPGKGWAMLDFAGLKIAVVNVQGRVFMSDMVDCPFKCLDKLLEKKLSSADLVFVDFHGEATSEKSAFANYFDGRVAAVCGTHTHVQTADERVLPGGTAFISDVGMCGATDSVIGMKKNEVIERFVTGLPKKFSVASEKPELRGVIIELDTKKSKAISIERVRVVGE